MKKRSFRSSSRTNKFDFQKLEPKQLLAGDLAALHQAPTTLPSGVNIVANGDFENLTPGANNFFDDAVVPDWTAVNSGDGQLLNIFNYNSDYTRVLDLDSTRLQFDQVTQDINTVEGEQYLLAFDFEAHPNLGELQNPTARTNDFEVSWNGELIATYTGGNLWHTAALFVSGGPGSSSQLMFSEIAEGDDGGGDGLGPLIDNVRVMRFVDSAITNGSFEVTENNERGQLRPFKVDGWSGAGTDVETRLIQIDESNATTTATDGNNYLNLDTSNTQRDVVYTDFTTVAGASYYVTFDVKADGTDTDTSDELRVRWNDDWATTMRVDTDWQSLGLMLEADSDLTRFIFLEPGDGNNGDGSGPQIDNVKIVRVDPEANNRAPVTEQLNDQTADFASTVELDVTSTDADGGLITYSIASDTSAGHNIPTITDAGNIVWVPSEAGETNLTVTATDNFGATDQMTFKVTVNPFDQFAGDGVLSAIPPATRNNIYTAAPEILINTSMNFEARVNTTEGLITLNLFANQAPKTVNNFVLLARDGFFDGLDVHRVLEDFIAQSGDATGTGSGSPGYSFVGEANNGLTFNQSGLLAMANPGSDNFNGSQFFLTYGTPTHLNGLHTIFGEIVGVDAAFQNLTVTADPNPIPGLPEIPRQGIVKSIINSVTIHVTNPEV